MFNMVSPEYAWMTAYHIASSSYYHTQKDQFSRILSVELVGSLSDTYQHPAM